MSNAYEYLSDCYSVALHFNIILFVSRNNVLKALRQQSFVHY